MATTATVEEVFKERSDTINYCENGSLLTHTHTHTPLQFVPGNNRTECSYAGQEMF
jgi:hypothetical protein